MYFIQASPTFTECEMDIVPSLVVRSRIARRAGRMDVPYGFESLA